MDEYIKKYGKLSLDKLMIVLTDSDLCDDESCVLHKAFKKYVKCQ